MIKITRNGETKIVTKGAYENFYKNAGFVVETPKPEIKDAKIVGERKPTKSIKIKVG